MNYNLQRIDEPTRNFASRFTLPLWNYIVLPRKPEDPPYLEYLFFNDYPLNEFIANSAPQDGDILEIFELYRRVLLTGVQIEVMQTADIILRPVTNSGLLFDSIDCNELSELAYVINGGTLNQSTDLIANSIVIDDPDYMGLRIESGAENLSDLQIRVQVTASDQFAWNTQTNSAEQDG